MPKRPHPLSTQSPKRTKHSPSNDAHTLREKLIKERDNSGVLTLLFKKRAYTALERLLKHPPACDESSYETFEEFAQFLHTLPGIQRCIASKRIGFIHEILNYAKIDKKLNDTLVQFIKTVKGIKTCFASSSKELVVWIFDQANSNVTIQNMLLDFFKDKTNFKLCFAHPELAQHFVYFSKNNTLIDHALNAFLDKKFASYNYPKWVKNRSYDNTLEVEESQNTSVYNFNDISFSSYIHSMQFNTELSTNSRTMVKSETVSTATTFFPHSRHEFFFEETLSATQSDVMHETNYSPSGFF